MTAIGRAAHRLTLNCPPVYYAGGERIAAFRRLAAAAPGPEDWVGSTSALPAALLGGGDPTSGISRLEDGTLLRDAVAADPTGWLGPELGGVLADGEIGLLLKLLDAAERLPVHCHPSRAAARRLLASPFGKTEGWCILHAELGSAVWLGFSRDLERAELLALIGEQDSEAMLGFMNRFEVAAGDLVYVPAGSVHAIGPGVFLAEWQEPTSFSILAEYRHFGLDESQATLGLGWEAAVGCFELRRSGADPDIPLVRRPELVSSDGGGSLYRLFPLEADEYFRAYRLSVAAEASFEPAGYRLLIVTAGEAELQLEDASSVTLRAGDTWVLPFATGAMRLAGAAELVVAMPPERVDPI